MSIFSKIGSLDQSKPCAQIYLQIIACCINWTQMDASKAYDRVNHWTLLRKLLKRSVSIIVVRMLLFWYSKQVVCIRWGTELSSYFNISNGVRQGGILSLSLFAIYMDDLSSLLNTSRIGRHISDVSCILSGRFMSNGLLCNSSAGID